MRMIYLCGKAGEGKYSLVDDADFEQLNVYKWYIRKSRNTSYATRTIYKGFEAGRVIQATTTIHRQLTGAATGYDVDHRNGNGLDNQRSNLRICAHSLNLQNRPANSNSTTGYKNIGTTPKGRYTVRVSILGKASWLGVYDTIEQAQLARDAYRKEQLADFA